MLTTLDRFMDKFVMLPDGCWEWKAALMFGYGIFCVKNGGTRAHRYSYELFKSEIPKGLQIDHLCRNKACINPEHLEAVTGRENTQRHHNLRTHCKNGHEVNQKNTYFAPYKHGFQRICRPCRSTLNKARWLRHKEKIAKAN